MPGCGGAGEAGEEKNTYPIPCASAHSCVLHTDVCVNDSLRFPFCGSPVSAPRNRLSICATSTGHPLNRRIMESHGCDSSETPSTAAAVPFEARLSGATTVSAAPPSSPPSSTTTGALPRHHSRSALEATTSSASATAATSVAAAAKPRLRPDCFRRSIHCGRAPLGAATAPSARRVSSLPSFAAAAASDPRSRRRSRRRSTLAMAGARPAPPKQAPRAVRLGCSVRPPSTTTTTAAAAADAVRRGMRSSGALAFALCLLTVQPGP